MSLSRVKMMVQMLAVLPYDMQQSHYKKCFTNKKYSQFNVDNIDMMILLKFVESLECVLILIIKSRIYAVNFLIINSSNLDLIKVQSYRYLDFGMKYLRMTVTKFIVSLLLTFSLLSSKSHNF